MCRAQEKKGSHKRISKPYQRLVRSEKMVFIIATHLCWEGLGAGGEEDEMAGWHNRLDGHEFEQALGFGDGREA